MITSLPYSPERQGIFKLYNRFAILYNVPLRGTLRKEISKLSSYMARCRVLLSEFERILRNPRGHLAREVIPMEWWLIIILIFGSLLVLFATGMPIAFAFLLVNVAGVFLFWGGEAGLRQLIMSISGSLATFVLVPVALFILMGEVMFRSGIGVDLIDVVDKWLGRLPGRLGIVAVGAGTIFSIMSGASMASTAMLGSLPVPEMEKRGYKPPMSLGPILGSGGLAIMIPPSGLAVLLAALAEISVAEILIGGIIPGLLMALFYAIYIIGRCVLQPSLAPSYDIPHIPILEKLIMTAKHLLPIGFIIFMVLGLILLGVVTPSEAAATGALAAFILAAAYKRLTWEVAKQSILSSIEITVMIFMIISGAKAFSQVLAFSGAGAGMLKFAVGLPLSPVMFIIVMQGVLLILGMFMSVIAVMMITIPIMFPIIEALGFEPVWFGLLLLLNIEMASTSPPYGLNLFVMKGVAPPHTKMSDIFRAAIPFLVCDLLVMALMIVIGDERFLLVVRSLFFVE